MAGGGREWREGQREERDRGGAERGEGQGRGRGRRGMGRGRGSGVKGKGSEGRGRGGSLGGEGGAEGTLVCVEIVRLSFNVSFQILVNSARFLLSLFMRNHSTKPKQLKL